MFAPFRRTHVVLETSDSESEELIYCPHPFRVSFCEVVVDRHQLAVLSGECVQIERHCCDKSFSLASRHLGNQPLVQNNSAYDLDIEWNHVPFQFMVADIDGLSEHLPACVLDCGKSFWQDIFESFPLCQALLEFRRLGGKLFVIQALI